MERYIVSLYLIKLEKEKNILLEIETLLRMYIRSVTGSGPYLCLLQCWTGLTVYMNV